MRAPVHALSPPGVAGAAALHLSSGYGHFEHPEPPFPGLVEAPAPEPQEPPPGLARLGALLTARRTTRRFRGASLRRCDLDALLWAGYGGVRALGGDVRRTVPSAGGLAPLIIDVAALRVEGLARAVYHQGSRGLTRGHPLPDELGDWFLTRHVDYGSASAIVLISADWARICPKYGLRGYRYALLEAGHVGQNIALAAAELGIGCAPVGGAVDQVVSEALHPRDPGRHGILYAFVVGEVAP